MPVIDIMKRNPTTLPRRALDDATRAVAYAEARKAQALQDLAEAERAHSDAAVSDSDDGEGVPTNATRRLRDVNDLVQVFDQIIIPAARKGLALARAGLEDAERLASYDVDPEASEPTVGIEWSLFMPESGSFPGGAPPIRSGWAQSRSSYRCETGVTRA